MTKQYWSHFDTIEFRDKSGDIIKDLCPRNMYPYIKRLSFIFDAIHSTFIAFNIHHMININDGKKCIEYEIIDKNNIVNPFSANKKEFPVEEIPDSIVLNKITIEDADMNDNVIIHVYTFIMTLKYKDKEYNIEFKYYPDYRNITSNFCMNEAYRIIHDVDKIYDQHLMSQAYFQTTLDLKYDGIIPHAVDINRESFTSNFINEIIISFRVLRDRYLIENKKYI